MEQIPGKPKSKLIERKWLVEIFSVVPPLIAATVVAYSNCIDPQKMTLGIFLAIGVVWLIIGSVLKVVHAYNLDKKEKEQRTYDGLHGALQVLYSGIKNNAGHDVGDLRATLHRVVYDEKNAPKELEQTLPYIGGEGKGEGRKFDVSHGIIGLAARTLKARYATRRSDDYEAFLEELCENWSYTPEAARSLKSDRMAWLAVPILNKSKTALAIVYLDSNIKNAFTREIVERVIASCAGIATYISHRYSLQAMSADATTGRAGAPQIETVIDAEKSNKALEDKIVTLTAAGEESITSSADALKVSSSAQT